MARKNGLLTQINDLWLKAAPKAAKREVGQYVNDLKHLIEKEIAGWSGFVEGAAGDLTVRLQSVDITLPGMRRAIGAEHPVVKTTNEMVRVFQKLGYSVADGPVVETDYYNFEALNFPPNHPARDTQDTLFIAGQQAKPQRGRLLLRTHTSPVQIRALKAHGAPLAVIAPGRVYRRDSDMTHSPMFHQLEGVVVGENISFANMKAALHGFLQAFFEREVAIRLRPSYFPFTEPSAEVDMSCVFCAGRGCRTCKLTGWLEVSGCGMMHPNVLAASGVDPERFTGYAFGAGIDRLAMLRYGVNDLRLFFENDLRFLKQFRTFSA